MTQTAPTRESDGWFRMGWNNCLYELARAKPELQEWLYQHRQEKPDAK